MSQPILSILIPTVVGREKGFDALFVKIYKLAQVAGHGLVSIVWERDNKEITIGEKRELLYKKATSLYSWQIDDDDDISDNAISLILEAIKQEPDCITFEEHCTIDGGFFSSNHSLDYPDWEGNGDKRFPDGFHYHRTPFFKDVIKTEIARSIPIEHIRFGEDHKWAQALKPHLKTEVHIPEYIYFYQHASSNFTERYGFDR